MLIVLITAKKNEAEIPEKEAKEHHENTWKGQHLLYDPSVSTDSVSRQ